MIGVAGPMVRRHRADAGRFLAGLAGGAMASALLVSFVVYLLGRTVHSVVPAQPRLVLLAVTCAVLGVADIVNRTPHVWRQVPQILVRQLTPGLRGVAWGFDLGLLVTTQKAASLVWATVAAVILVKPSVAPALVIGMAVVASSSVAVLSLRWPNNTVERNQEKGRLWVRPIRVVSGTALLGMAVVTLVQAARP